MVDALNPLEIPELQEKYTAWAKKDAAHANTILSGWLSALKDGVLEEMGANFGNYSHGLDVLRIKYHDAVREHFLTPQEVKDSFAEDQRVITAKVRVLAGQLKQARGMEK